MDNLLRVILVIQKCLYYVINIDIYQIDVCGHERRHVTCEFILPIETAILKWQHIHVM